MEFDLNSLTEINETNFRFSNKRALLTYAGHIAKTDLRDVFTAMGAKQIEIAHETGETGYQHTHVLVDFGRTYETRNPRHFDYGVHPNIRKVTTNGHWNNLLNYLAKQDPENAHLSRDVTLFDRVAQRQNLAEVMRLVTQPGEAMGYRTLWEARGRQEYANTVTLRPGWQTNLKDEILSRNDDRKLIWVIDREGGSGKSVLCRYFEDEFNSLLITQMGGSRDLATVIKNAIEVDGWNDGIILVDLPRQAETKAIYEPLEMVLNGRMTALKYSGGRLRWKTKCCVVFANFAPNVNAFSMDRWDIRELVRDSEGLLTLRNKSPHEFRFEAPILPGLWE